MKFMIAVAVFASGGFVAPAAAQTTVLFDFEGGPVEGDINPVFVDGASGFVLSHTEGAVRGDAQWANDGAKCFPHAGIACMRVSDVGVGDTPVTTTINFSEPVSSVSIWARSFSAASITPIVEGGGMLAPIPVTVNDEQYVISGSGPYIGLLMSAASVNTMMWDDLQVTFGMPVIPRDALLDLNSEDGEFLAIDPDDADTIVIGETGVVPLDSLAKNPINGRVFAGNAIPGGETGPVRFTYGTRIRLDPNTSLDGVDSVGVLWSTSVNTGNVIASDLELLHITLFVGPDILYTDTAIANGIILPIGGAARTSDDVLFEFNHADGEIFQGRNALDVTMQASSGTQYQLQDNAAFPIDGQLVMRKFENGDSVAFVIADILSQRTRLVSIEGAAALFEIDELTGQATPIGVLGDDISSMNAADHDANGTLWAALTVDFDGECEGDCDFEALATIDEDTGSADIVGPLFAEKIDGISFDSNGVLWGVSSQDHELYQIDLETGEASFVVDVRDGEGGLPPAGGFQSLQFACDDDPFDEALGALYGGTGEDDGGGGELFIIDPDSGIFSQVGNQSTTGGSTLGGLALHTTCEPVVANVPTPEGENVTVISVAAFEQVAKNVVQAGTTNANFCVVPDIRYVPDGNGGFNFVARNLNLAEVSGMGSCTGPLVPGEPETWESDIFPNLNLVIASWYQSYRGKFTLPGEATPTDGFWLVLGVIRSTAEFDGPVAYTNFPETLIDYSMTPVGERPECDNALPWRSLDIAGTVPAFGDFPNFEGNRMIVETGQCNRNRGITRRTTHISPVRYIYPKAGARAELMNLAAQISGISGTLQEAAACADPALIADMQASLNAANLAQRFGSFDDAEEHFEEIARSAQNAESFGTGFANCDIERNYRGNFISRAITAAFSVHDRFQHPVVFQKYFVPADIDIPLLDNEVVIP